MFQKAGAMVEEAHLLCPIKWNFFADGTCSMSLLPDLMRQVAPMMKRQVPHTTCRMPHRALKVKTITLNQIGNQTGNQCSSRCSGLVCGDIGAHITAYATPFCTSRWTFWCSLWTAICKWFFFAVIHLGSDPYKHLMHKLVQRFLVIENHFWE